MVILMLLLIFVCTFVRQRLGFGFSMLFIPIACIFIGFESAFRMTIALEVVAGVLMVIEFWHDVRLKEALGFKALGIIGLGIGYLITPFVPQQMIVIGAMSAIIAISIFFLRSTNAYVRQNFANMVLCGVASGLLTIWTSLSGPPVVIYYAAAQRRSNAIKGLLSGYFLILYVLTLALLFWKGRYADYSYWSLTGAGAVTVIVAYLFARLSSFLQTTDLRKFSFYFIILVAALVLLLTIFAPQIINPIGDSI